MGEEVLVVPTELFHECGHFEGFTNDVERYQPLFDDTNQRFLDREEAEEDPSWKQLIPYIVIRKQFSPSEHRTGAYWRGQGQGEIRLHGKRSIGIGGHINPCDADGEIVNDMLDLRGLAGPMYKKGLMRELLEELLFNRLPKLLEMPIVGLINDDQNPVGKVHLGIVHRFLIYPSVDVIKCEEDILDFEWVKDQNLISSIDEFEPWSQICIHNGVHSASMPELMDTPTDNPDGPADEYGEIPEDIDDEAE